MVLALSGENPVSACNEQPPCREADWRACGCTHLGQAELSLPKGAEAEVQLGQPGQIAQPAGQVSLPPGVAAPAFPHMPRCSVQTYGQASESIHPAQAIGLQRRSAQGATDLSIAELRVERAVRLADALSTESSKCAVPGAANSTLAYTDLV